MKIQVEVEFPEFDGPDGFDSVMSEVVAEVTKRILKACRTAIITDTRASVKAQIDDSAHSIIEETLSDPVRKTNSYGEPIGESVPLRAHIIKRAEEYMLGKVDAKSGRETTYNRASLPRGQYFLKQVVAAHLDSYYSEQVAAAVAGVKAELDGKLDALVREAIKEVVS